MNSLEKHSVRSGVMAAIRMGEVHMRPRWYFLLLSALSATCALVVFFLLLYVASLAVFFLRDSGVWFAPSFGVRGWVTLARSLPWLLILALLVSATVLGLLMRRFPFVYTKPLLVSVLGITACILAGGVLIAQTPLHRALMLSAKRGELPPPIGMMYGTPLLSFRPDDVYHGRVVSVVKGGLVIADEDRAATTSVLLTPQTRLPFGATFALGTRIVVVGDIVATGTVRAFGVCGIDEYPE